MLRNKARGLPQSSESPPCDLTPRRASAQLLRSHGVNAHRQSSLFKAMALGIAAVRTVKAGKVKRSLLTDFRKSRLITSLSKHTKTSRDKYRVKKGGRRRPLKLATDRHEQVRKYYLRPDVSTCLPGKRDTVKVGKQKMAKHVLQDTIQNTYSRFKTEYSSCNVSLSLFRRLRPVNVKPVSFTRRDVCLCAYHQNLALKLRSVNKHTRLGVFPDQVLQRNTDEDIKSKLQMIPHDSVAFHTWKSVEHSYGRTSQKKSTMKTKLITQTMSRQCFIDTVMEEVSLMRAHISRVKAQYKAVREIKNRLPTNHVTVQMDFAENWTAHAKEEVQSAYYNQEQFTIHPIVCHFRKNDNLETKTYIIVSDDRSHMAESVLCFLFKVVPMIKQDLVQDLQCIHYISDSPSSQYRNIKMMSILAKHQLLFNINASYTYLESGHGKGPCDGSGGSSKRNADLAIKKGVHIDSAEDYVSYQNTTDSAMTHVLVSQKEIAAAKSTMTKIMKGHSKITGTLTIHAVTSQQPGLLQTRQTSCFGSCCFDEGIFHCGCAGWTEQLVFDGLSETEGAVSVTRESEQAGLVAMETEPAAVETEQAEPAAVETEEAEFLETDAEQAESVTETEQAEPTMTETEQAEPTMTETEQAEPTMTEKEETEAPATEIEQAKVPETEQAQLPQTETEQAQLPQTETEQAQLPQTETEQAQLPQTETEQAQLPQTETEQAQLPQTETEQAQLPQTEQPECVTKEHEQTELTLLIRQEENKKTELTERKTTEAEDGVQSNEIVTEKNEDYCYKVGDMVMVNYNGKEYCGQILKHDPEDSDKLTYHIDFLEKVGEDYVRPKKVDQLWVKESNILRKVPAENSYKSQDYRVGDYVRAKFQGRLYYGRIVEHCGQENEYRIHFLVKKGTHYVWPKEVDELWMKPKSIVEKINPTTRFDNFYL